MISKIDTTALSNAFIKKGQDIEQGIEEAIQQVAEYAQNHAKQSNLYKGDKLREAIKIQKAGSYVRTVIADKPYAHYVEYGRGEVRPVNAKALRFVINGEVIFSKYAKATSPRPFMAQAKQAAERAAPRIIEQVIGRHIK